MIKRIFSLKFISKTFKIAVILNTIGLLIDLFAYHFNQQGNIFISIANVINNVSISIISLIIISQIFIIFINNHQKLVHQYKFLTVSIASCICLFFFWLIKVDDNIQEELIIFFSKSTRIHEAQTKTIIIIIGIFIMLIIDLYKEIKEPTSIDDSSIPQMLRSLCKKVINKHLFLLLCIFGIIHIQKLQKLSLKLLHQSELSFIEDFSLLEIAIPTGWCIALIYFFYQRYYKKNRNA